MARWWRFYTDAHKHHKIRGLTNAEFRFWTEVVSIASDLNDAGRIGTAQTVARLVTERCPRVQKKLERLTLSGLVWHQDGAYFIHNWASRQYTSDQSTQRVKAWRGRSTERSSNVSETPPDLQTVRQTTDQKRFIGRSAESAASVARPSGAAPSADYGRYYFEKDTNGVKAPDGPANLSPGSILVKQGTPSYDAWWRHLKANPKINALGGWYFPTEYPPVEVETKSDGLSPAEDEEIPF